MEAHPVPQNVTNFEFHLIGDMTVKQFGYLAVGMAVAYILFITISTSVPLLAWPLIVFFALSGIAFAFLPISQRPLDHWVAAYFRAVFKPTQRAWKMKDKTPKDPLFKDRLSIYLTSLDKDLYRQQKGTPAPTTPKLGIISQMAPSTVPIVQATPTQPVTLKSVPAKANLPSSQELEKTVELAKEAQGIQTKIVDTEKLINQIRTSSAVPGEDSQKYTQQFQKALGELQTLTQEASKISEEMADLAHSQSAPTQPRITVPAVKKQIPTNIVLTSTPNVVNGIVTDALNNYMEGVIVVTHDKQGLPVRALKTNKLGQFVAATPLPNGTYTLSLEKDSLNFDNIEISLEGKVLSPLVISAKKGVVG